MTDESDDILSRVEDGVGFVTLNRPKAINSLNQGMVDELSAVLAGWEQDATVGVVVLSGAAEIDFIPSPLAFDVKRAAGAKDFGEVLAFAGVEGGQDVEIVTGGVLDDEVVSAAAGVYGDEAHLIFIKLNGRGGQAGDESGSIGAVLDR